MNFVDMEVYNRIYKELAPTDENGGTKIIHSFSPGTYAKTAYAKASFRLKGTVNVRAMVTSFKSVFSNVYVYLIRNGGEQETIFSTYTRDNVDVLIPVSVNGGDTIEIKIPATANQESHGEIQAWIVDKEEKFAKFSDMED